MSRVGLYARELRPAKKVSRPVSLSNFLRFYKIGVLDGLVVASLIETNTFGTIIGNAFNKKDKLSFRQTILNMNSADCKDKPDSVEIPAPVKISTRGLSRRNSRTLATSSSFAFAWFGTKNCVAKDLGYRGNIDGRIIFCLL